jgi:uncharacterized membrane protein YuzA (DUF378 family)
MKNRDALSWVGLVLLVAGALNWGILGLTSLAMGGNGTNVLGLLLGQWSAVLNLVYVLVGIAGLWKLYKVFM